MRTRIEVVTGAALAVIIAVVTGSVVAAAVRLTADGSSISPSDQAVQAEPTPVSAETTESPARGESPQPPSPEPAQRSALETFPVPAEAVASTRADAVLRPSSVPQHKPTPLPQRKTIVLDPGHGRGDPGAVHHTSSGVDLSEAESNLAIAQHLQRFLEERGYDVYVTRSGFGRPLSPSSLTRLLISADLWARVRLAEAVAGDLFISIHSNGSTNPRQSGVEIWYCGKHEYGDLSGRLAAAVLDAAIQGLEDYGYNSVRRGTQEDAAVHKSGDFCQFLVTREARTPAILTELLFLTNDADAAVLKDDRAREAMARRIADAVDRFVLEQGIGEP